MVSSAAMKAGSGLEWFRKAETLMPTQKLGTPLITKAMSAVNTESDAVT